MRSSTTPSFRRTSVRSAAPGRDLDASERQALPFGFDAVGEALVSGRSPVAACAVVGRTLARDGASLGEALSGLRATYTALGGAVPDYEATVAIAVAWSEQTLDFLNDVSCEDPLTGLASLPHLRARLSELYRAAEPGQGSVRRTHALVVLDVGTEDTTTGGDAVFVRALRLTAVTEAIREVFSGEVTMARVGGCRVVVLVRRAPALGGMLGELGEVFRRRRLGAPSAVWIEGLPDDGRLAGSVLSELAR